MHRPAKFEMVVDPKAMTITVGPKVFDKPDLARRKEWDFDLKEEICGAPETVRDNKEWNKFYAAQLGCKFNYRFFGANYGLWIAGRMERRTGNMLKWDGKNWMAFNTDLVRRAHAALPYVNEAERDRLHHLIPIILTFTASPQAIRAKIGRGAWRRAANNTVSRNLLIMNATLRCTRDRQDEAFSRILDMPSGIMRGIGYSVGEAEMIAARITPRKRPMEFQQTVHLIEDTRRMMLPGEFNPQWSLARIRQEHEAATRMVMQKRYSNEAFAPAWSFQDGPYTATLLTSQAEIATEGEVQHHCVASYARMAAHGECAILRIEGKERATLSVMHGTVQQVYGACNAAVSAECKLFASKVAVQYTGDLINARKAA